MHLSYGKTKKDTTVFNSENTVNWSSQRRALWHPRDERKPDSQCSRKLMKVLRIRKSLACYRQWKKVNMFKENWVRKNGINGKAAENIQEWEPRKLFILGKMFQFYSKRDGKSWRDAMQESDKIEFTICKFNLAAVWEIKVCWEAPSMGKVRECCSGPSERWWMWCKYKWREVDGDPLWGQRLLDWRWQVRNKGLVF